MDRLEAEVELAANRTHRFLALVAGTVLVVLIVVGLPPLCAPGPYGEEVHEDCKTVVAGKGLAQDELVICEVK